LKESSDGTVTEVVIKLCGSGVVTIMCYCWVCFLSTTARL